MKYIIISMLFFSFGCKRNVTMNDSEKSIFKSDQMELDLHDNFKHQTLVRNFESLGIKYLCHLDKAKNICVFDISNSSKSLEEMIAFFDKEVGVEGAKRTIGCNSI